MEAHEHRQDPGENGRRIEHFIGENEHLYEIIGGRPVYCQKLINGPGRGKETRRYMSKRDLLHEIVLLLETKTNIATLSTTTQSKN